MKLKIISDGTVPGSRVVNAETGEEIEGVQAVKWELAVGGFAEAQITLTRIPAELIGGFQDKNEKAIAMRG